MMRGGTGALGLCKGKGRLELCSSSLPKVSSHVFSINISKNSLNP